MGTLLIILGWTAALFCTAVAASSVIRVIRHTATTRRLWNAPGWPGLPLLYSCAAVAAFTALGALPVLAGSLVTALLAAVLLEPLAKAQVLAIRQGKGRRTALRSAVTLVGIAKAGPRWLIEDLRSLPNLRKGPQPRHGSGPAGPAGPAPVAPADPAVRAVPSLRDDPALGPPPAPHEIAAASEVPVPWAELASWIAGFHPEDDNQQSWFIHGHAAGLVAVAHALTAHAETVTNDIGLDPSYGGAVLELADLVAQPSGDAALVDKRYHLIYGDTKQAIDNGLILPHNPRQWFGGNGQPQGGSGTSGGQAA